MQTLTISASVRPGRVAVLFEITDPEWMHSCRHILEVFSSLWGGHANIIIPTDGNTIQPLFWQILEKFDPDYICAHGPMVALETITKAVHSLSCYCSIYTKYLTRLLTVGALPDPNDSGDIELFLYAVDDEHIVVTSERKWIRMAEGAGFGHRGRLAAK